MNYQAYLGHESQLCAVEEVRLVGGKGDNMRLLQIRNAAGLELTVSADRCADLSRVIFKGDNMGYFAPCGYVAPAYYDDAGAGFLKSFTAGFLTTCGLTAVGSACVDEGEALPLHGTIGNIPCERIWWEETEEAFVIHAQITDARLYGRKMRLNRTLTVGKFENTVVITDKVTNLAAETSPCMLMYHMNMGYPLLSEEAVLTIPSTAVAPRDETAAKGIADWDKLQKPTVGFAEQCFYHSFEGEGKAALYNPAIGKGLEITYDPAQLPCFTQWKQMGVTEYVLGLEPGNCTPDGRDILRKEGRLQFLEPGESKTFEVKITFKTEA